MHHLEPLSNIFLIKNVSDPFLSKQVYQLSCFEVNNKIDVNLLEQQ